MMPIPFASDLSDSPNFLNTLKLSLVQAEQRFTFHPDLCFLMKMWINAISA